MTLAIKCALLASGVFLLTAMLVGILKYRGMMRSEKHEAPVYIDIAHRASLLYAFAALVIAKLLEFSPFSENVQILIGGIPLVYFALTIIGYVKLGLENRETTQFSERNFITTWFMYGLIAGEIGGIALIVGGFIYTQFFI
jgi:hypothetical protein